MKDCLFTGVATALATPFSKDGVNTETGEYIPGITIEEIDSITVKVEGGV